MKHNKGFTVIELVVVGVLIAIILIAGAVIASNKIKEQKVVAFESTVRMLIRGVDFMTLQNSRLSASELTEQGIIAAGGNKDDISILTVVSLNPTNIIVEANPAGSLKGCKVTNATLTNISRTGTAGADGVISGC